MQRSSSAGRVVCAFRLTMLMLACLLFLDVAPAAADVLYSVTYSNNRINQLNADTGALLNSFVPPVVAQNGGGQGLAASSSELFYCSIDNTNIYRISPTTGATLGSFPRPAAVTVGIDSLAYGNSLSGATLFALDYTNNVVYLLNPSTGAVFNQYTTSYDAVGGMDFDSTTNQLYVSDVNGVIRATNPDTGAVINSFATGAFQDGIGFVGGRLFTAPQSVATISERNKATGAVINSFASPGGLVGALAGPPVPEPTTAALAMISAAAIFARRRPTTRR